MIIYFCLTCIKNPFVCSQCQKDHEDHSKSFKVYLDLLLYNAFLNSIASNVKNRVFALERNYDEAIIQFKDNKQKLQKLLDGLSSKIEIEKEKVKKEFGKMKKDVEIILENIIKAEAISLNYLEFHEDCMRKMFQEYQEENNSNSENEDCFLKKLGQSYDNAKSLEKNFLEFQSFGTQDQILEFIKNNQWAWKEGEIYTDITIPPKRRKSKFATALPIQRENKDEKEKENLKEKEKMNFENEEMAFNANFKFADIIEAIKSGCIFYPKFRFFTESDIFLTKFLKQIETLKEDSNLPLQNKAVQIEEQVGIAENAQENIQFSEDSQQMTIFSNKTYNECQIELTTSKHKSSFTGINCMIILFDFYLALGNRDGNIEIYSLESFNEVLITRSVENEVTVLLQLDLAEQNQRFLVAGYDNGLIIVYQLLFRNQSLGLNPFCEFKNSKSNISGLIDLKDGLFVSISFDCSIVLLNIFRQESFHKVETTSPMKTISPSEGIFATGDDEGVINMYKLFKRKGKPDFFFEKKYSYKDEIFLSPIKVVKFNFNNKEYLYYSNVGYVKILRITYNEQTRVPQMVEPIVSLGPETHGIYKFLVIESIVSQIGTMGNFPKEQEEEMMLDVNSENLEKVPKVHFQIIAFLENHQILSFQTNGINNEENSQTEVPEIENMKQLLGGSNDPFGSSLFLKKSTEDTVWFYTCCCSDRKVNLWRMKRS